MNSRMIEQSLRNCIEQDTPDLLSDLMSASVKKLTEEDYIVKQRPAERTPSARRFVAAFGSAAAICLLCVSFLLNGTKQTSWSAADADTFISIDVNPSIEMLADENDKVMELRGLNDDAKAVLQDVDEGDKSLEQVVSSLVDSMTEHGYLKPKVRNSILVSVENEDSEKADDIKGAITDDIYKALDKKEIDSIVLTQSVKKTKKLEEEAQELNVSVGKMSLIRSLASRDAELDVRQMAEMSIQDISNLAQERKVDITDVVDYNTAAKKEEQPDPEGVPVEKTEKTTERPETHTGEAGPKTPSDPSGAASPGNAGYNPGTSGTQTTVPPTDTEQNYEVRDPARDPSEPPVSTNEESPQVVTQDPNVVAKPVEPPKTPEPEQNTDNYEIQESSDDSGEIIE